MAGDTEDEGRDRRISAGGDMRFLFQGKVKPYVRMTQRGKWIRKDAQAYLASKYDLAMQLREQMGENGWMPLDHTPMMVTIRIGQKIGLHRCDIDNQAKACLDAANGIIWRDDRWVDVLLVSRTEALSDQVEIIVAPLQGGPNG